MFAMSVRVWLNTLKYTSGQKYTYLSVKQELLYGTADMKYTHKVQYNAKIVRVIIDFTKAEHSNYSKVRKSTVHHF